MSLATLIRVVVYEDNPALRASLSQLLGCASGLALAGAFGHCRDMVAEVAVPAPDVLLLDIDLPSLSGIEGLSAARAGPGPSVLLLTVFEENERVLEATCAETDGYLVRKASAVRLLEAIAEAHAGGTLLTPTVARQAPRLFPQPASGPSPSPRLSVAPELSPVLSSREHGVLDLLVEGYSYKMIGTELGISLDTVRSHIKHIYRKLHVRSGPEAVGKALRQGLA